MASWNEWDKGTAEKLGWTSFPAPSTPATYAAIKEKGIPTVEWNAFHLEEGKSLDEQLPMIMEFIKHFSPCLFIYDPLTKDLTKNFLFNVTDIKEIVAWSEEHKKNLNNYSYLVTSKVEGYQNSFVGGALSDGKGKLFVETLHRPGICNQQELSQKNGDGIHNCFTTDDFELSAIEKMNIPISIVKRIVNLYGDKKGYFEFVKGIHNGKKQIVTTGLGDFSFPAQTHEFYSMNNAYRTRARALKEQF